jgi:DNA-binding MarR family transcriptional regulator
MSAASDDRDTSEGGFGDGPGNVLFDIWLVSRSVHALIDDAIRESGLDADEFAIYSVLASGDGMTPSELARWMAAPSTTVSSYVKRFERRGDVRRSPNVNDRRSHRLELSAKGRRVHLAAGELFAPVLAAVEDALGSDGPDTHRQLLELHRIVEAATSGRATG